VAVVDEDLVPLLMQPGTDVPTSLDELAAAIRPPWVADAACREHLEVDFFPQRGEFPDAARAVCSGCLVRRECLACGGQLARRDPGPCCWACSDAA
jgi:hypothetical protein